MNYAKQLFCAAVVLFLLALPLLPALAQVEAPPCPPGLVCPGETDIGGGVSGINNLIMTVIGWLAGIAFVVAVLFLVIGGFMYITSGGNEETTETARRTIINAIIGIIIVVLSYVIIAVIVNLVSGNRAVNP